MKLFRMDRETYDDEVVNTSACDLINFYYKMEEKYKRRRKFRSQPINKI